MSRSGRRITGGQVRTVTDWTPWKCGMLYIRVLNLILSDLGSQGGYKGQFENLKVKPTHFLEWLEGQGGKVGDKDRSWKLLTSGHS